MRLFLQLQLPEIVVCPPIGEIDDNARCRDLLRRMEAIEKNLSLQISLSDVSKGESKGMFDEQGTRWLYQLRNLFHQSQRNRRQACLVEDPLKQPHGLLAHGSSRSQQNEIDTINVELLRHFRAGAFQEGLHDRNVPHE